MCGRRAGDMRRLAQLEPCLVHQRGRAERRARITLSNGRRQASQLFVGDAEQLVEGPGIVSAGGSPDVGAVIHLRSLSDK